LAIISIQVEYEFELVDQGSKIKKGPPFSVLINGIYLEGARWDQNSRILCESVPKIHYDLLPPIRLCPKKKPAGNKNIFNLLT
jgi:dynein heavy chain